MVDDPSFYLRTGDAGEQVVGSAGHVLTFQEDGTVRGEAPGASGALRATWCLGAATITFAPDQPGPHDVVSEAGTFTGIEVGDTIFIPSVSALVGAFHSGVAAPQFGGLWDVLSKPDDQEMTIQRNAGADTSAKI